MISFRSLILAVFLGSVALAAATALQAPCPPLTLFHLSGTGERGLGLVGGPMAHDGFQPGL
jgi:hypothetical protein